MRYAVTLNGMYNVDNTLFAGLTVPTGIDREVLIDTILYDYGDMYLTQTDPVWTKAAITVWGKRNKYYMDELFKTLNYVYNPIENYDRDESFTDTYTGTSSNTTSGNTTVDSEGNVSVDTTGSTTSGGTVTASGSNQTDNKLAAYNANAMQNDTQSVQTTSDTSTDSSTGSTTGTSETESSGTTTTTTSGTESGQTGGTNTRTGRIHGNIGVTTTQQMIQSQREVIKISWYDTIAKLFASDFLILIY